MPRRQPPIGLAAAGRLFVDSSGWIALVSPRDQHHAEADTVFRQAIARRVPLLTTNLVLAEIHRFFLFRAGALPARRVLERVEASAHVTIEFASPAHHRAALIWLDRLGERRISYTDALSFAVMEAAGCTTVIGFDADFRQAGFSLCAPGG